MSLANVNIKCRTLYIKLDYQLRQSNPTFLVLSFNEKLMAKSFLFGVFSHWQLSLLIEIPYHIQVITL